MAPIAGSTLPSQYPRVPEWVAPRVPARTRQCPRVPESTREYPRGPDSTREYPRVRTREYPTGPDSTPTVPDSTRQDPRVTKPRAGVRRSADTLPCCAGRGRRMGEAVVRRRSVGHPRTRSAGCPAYPTTESAVAHTVSRKQGAAHARNAEGPGAHAQPPLRQMAPGGRARTERRHETCARRARLP